MLQNISNTEFSTDLCITRSARNIHISDSDLDNLKIIWDMCYSPIQRLSKEDGVSLLRMFLDIAYPEMDYCFSPPPGMVYIGQIWGQYVHERWGRKMFSDSTAQIEIGQIRPRGQPTHQ